MAAYAALVSLMNIMENIENHPPISNSVDKFQIKILGEKVGFLLDFMESHNSRGKETEDLERQIASAAHAAEDVIESHVVNQILAASTGDHVETSSSFLLDLQKDIKKKVMKVQEKIQSKDEKSRLQKVMKDMDSIKKKIMKIEKKGGSEGRQARHPVPATTPRPLTAGKNTMVGFDDELVQLMEWLTGTQPNRLIIPIVGMGGIGKSTLARNVYGSSVTVHYFHVRAWVTVSQRYSVRDILLELLSCQEISENLTAVSNENSQKTEDKLGEQLYKSLSGRRYLIILDDIWSIEAWNEIKLFFPDSNNGSRIVVTTRISDVAAHLGSWCLKMNFLDEKRSWKLFCEKTFAEESCPPELMKIGKKIVQRCRGLPLSIVVIGGLLQKSSRTQEYWQSIAKDINSILSSREDEHCLNILSLSYNHLPPHLKPCFLYMGVFPEDSEIRVSRLIKVWVAEGFLKPNQAQSLEEVAEGYLIDLIKRNLILVRTWKSNGKIKTCDIHDLLRDLCLRLADKENFLCVMRVVDIPRGIDTERRIVFHDRNSKMWSRSRVIHAPRSTSVVRSLLCKGAGALSLQFRLLRVLSMVHSDTGDGIFDCDSAVGIFDQVNLRYFACGQFFVYNIYMLPSSISLLWNLQTLILRGTVKRIVAPSEIWELPKLRHLEFDEIYLPDPPRSDEQDGIVLENLHTLLKIVNFKWSEKACKRIPNIKKLHINYDDFSASSHDYCLYNIGSLHKLESLNCLLGKLPDRDDLLRNLTLPSSLKKLSLTKCQLHWEDLTMIGSLPHLEVLKLELGSVIGLEWNPIEGQFLRLKYLKIHYSDLMYWNVESSHFPVLESLILDQMFKLDEIPSGIGEIPTLKDIRLDYCKVSAAISAMKILEEQESFGNDGLQVRVQFWALTELESVREMLEQQSFTSNNFFS